MRKERTLAQLSAVILINEIEPRAKRHNHYPPHQLAGLIAFAEHEGATTRSDTRRYLDAYYREHSE